jgi:hypothetical protein
MYHRADRTISRINAISSFIGMESSVVCVGDFSDMHALLDLSLTQDEEGSPTAAFTTALTPITSRPSKLEAAYHRADKAIQQIVDLLAA